MALAALCLKEGKEKKQIDIGIVSKVLGENKTPGGIVLTFSVKWQKQTKTSTVGEHLLIPVRF
jgi:hypothetical protein